MIDYFIQKDEAYIITYFVQSKQLPVDEIKSHPALLNIQFYREMCHIM